MSRKSTRRGALSAHLQPLTASSANRTKRQLEPRYLRKSKQLCKQVERAVGLALAASHDERLNGLIVDEVFAAGDAYHLTVVVLSERNDEEVQHALRGARAMLRGEVAAEINRKRAPQLTFIVLPLGQDV